MNLLSLRKSAAADATKRARERLEELLADDISDDRAAARVLAERLLAIAGLRTRVQGSSSAVVR